MDLYTVEGIPIVEPVDVRCRQTAPRARHQAPGTSRALA